MPRPRKCRRICRLPENLSFGPIPGGPDRNAIEMTVDEFETVRLIDLEGFSQEQCAANMNVARTTAQAIYNSARVKLAEALVNGRELVVGGGDFILCDGEAGGYGCGRCRRRRCMSAEENPVITDGGESDGK